MAKIEKEDVRLQTIPVIYVRGNHYDVGFAVVMNILFYKAHLYFNLVDYREKRSLPTSKISFQRHIC